MLSGSKQGVYAMVSVSGGHKVVLIGSDGTVKDTDFVEEPTLASDGTVYGKGAKGLVAVPAGGGASDLKLDDLFTLLGSGVDGAVYFGSPLESDAVVFKGGRRRGTVAVPEGAVALCASAGGTIHALTLDDELVVMKAGKVLHKLPLAAGALAPVMGADGTVHVVDPGAGKVILIRDRTIVAQLPVGAGPALPRVGPSGKVYVASKAGVLTVIQGAKATDVTVLPPTQAPDPFEIALGPDGAVYALDAVKGNLHTVSV